MDSASDIRGANASNSGAIHPQNDGPGACPGPSPHTLEPTSVARPMGPIDYPPVGGDDAFTHQWAVAQAITRSNAKSERSELYPDARFRVRIIDLRGGWSSRDQRCRSRARDQDFSHGILLYCYSPVRPTREPGWCCGFNK